MSSVVLEFPSYECKGQQQQILLYPHSPKRLKVTQEIVQGDVRSVDDRNETKLPKFRCFGSFGSFRFGSVRCKFTETKHLAKFNSNISRNGTFW